MTEIHAAVPTSLDKALILRNDILGFVDLMRAVVVAFFMNNAYCLDSLGSYRNTTISPSRTIFRIRTKQSKSIRG